MLALRPGTGRLVWHFQFTPHDTHDWDSAHVPVLLEAQVNGRKRKLVVNANRNGFYYVLDRTTGEFLAGKPTQDAMAAKAREFVQSGQTAGAFLVWRSAAEAGNVQAQV